jgi:endonuclease YncB( thermonuclease family)
MAAPPEIILGHAVAIDGDSLRFDHREGRLQGIDAFEWNQTCKDAEGRSWACGAAAKVRLASLVNGRPIACVVHGKDRYRRLIVSCDVAGQDIGAALVRAGLAIAYRKYSDRYVADEDAAKAAKAGAWRGTFEAPEVFRRKGRKK